MEVYDPSDDTWNRVDDMANHRGGHTATILGDGRVLVIGGIAADGFTPVTEAELFDPESGAWSSAGIVLTPRTGHTATLLADGRVLVVGEDNLYQPYAELFDPGSGEWSPAGSPAGPRFRHTATLLADGRVLVAGGETRTGDLRPIDSAEIWNPETGEWTDVPGMDVARSGHSAVLLVDGRVMVMGGASVTLDGRSGELGSTEIFDPGTGDWKTVQTACNGRFSHDALVLADGRVIVIGGQTGAEVAPTVESYDPAANTWSVANTLELGRVGATISALAGGDLMVAGGSLRSSFEVTILREDPQVQASVGAIRPTGIEWSECDPFKPTAN